MDLIRAKITGKSNSSGRWKYAWEELLTAYTTGGDATQAGRATGTLTLNPAVEVNDTEVPTDTVVWLRERGFVAGQMWYEFTHRPVVGITAKEIDDTPTYTGATTLEFDQGDGFSLTQPGTGRVRIDMLAATASQAGIVSTTTQTFAGPKTFTSSVTADGLTSTGQLIAAGNSYLGGVVFVEGGRVVIDGGGTSSPGGGVVNFEFSGSGVHASIYALPGPPASFYLVTGDGSGPVADLFIADLNCSGGITSSAGITAGGIIQAAGHYRVAGGNIGVDGALGPGAYAVGGIITSVGSGSFLADPGDGIAGGTY